jgi:transposase
LPAYAPELNPVEQVWNHTKYTDLANYKPDDIASLGQAVARSIRSTRAQTPLLRSFFRHSRFGL